jgi:monoamine oxidase
VGFIAGEAQRRWMTQSREEREKAVKEQLMRLFNNKEALEPLMIVEHDWTDEEWSRGCYMATCMPGALTEVGKSLRAPAGRIHWAGTETGDVWIGYMDGAL